MRAVHYMLYTRAYRIVSHCHATTVRSGLVKSSPGLIVVYPRDDEDKMDEALEDMKLDDCSAVDFDAAAADDREATTDFLSVLVDNARSKADPRCCRYFWVGKRSMASSTTDIAFVSSVMHCL